MVGKMVELAIYIIATMIVVPTFLFIAILVIVTPLMLVDKIAQLVRRK
jgi:hypothetical protein